MTTLFPGYIRSEMNARVRKTPLPAGTKPGVRSMVKAIERERTHAYTPAWPWTPLSFAKLHLPLRWLAKVS